MAPSCPGGIRLQVTDLTKHYPGVTALDRVALTLHAGEVLAVVGENGAGKSTLMKILAGVERPDSGRIELEGTPLELRSVHQALALGLVLIHQEMNLAENLDAASNIFLGREPRWAGWINRRRLNAEARRLLHSLAMDFSPHLPVERLAIGHRQMVEIAKALSVNARVLIMDEPTSSLSLHETETLFRVIRDLRQRGVSIIYVSHRLAEVQQIADRVVVLRDGKIAGELPGKGLRIEQMVSMMVGRDVSLFAGKLPRPAGPPRLEVRDLATAAHPRQQLSFTVLGGEIVGLAGLVGAGRTEVLDALFGIAPARQGTMRVDGERVAIRTPRDAIRAGLALVPEDRKLQGLILEMSVEHNIDLAALDRQAHPGGFIDFRREHRAAAQMVQQLQVRPPNVRQLVQNLSGGNQQKVVLAKWLLLDPRVLLLDEPTRGVDVGAKEEIYLLMERAAQAGAAILFASSDLPEVLGLADRILVLHEGRLAGELPRAAASEEAVMHLATGGAG